MRLLILDSSDFGYKLDHKTPIAEEVKEFQTRGDYKNCLVIFATVEKQDSEKILPRVAQDIKEIALKNKRELLFLNPFAHLSANLARPKEALQIVTQLESLLSANRGFKVVHGAFGWYKQFDLKILGHDNSQIYREY